MVGSRVNHSSALVVEVEVHRELMEPENIILQQVEESLRDSGRQPSAAGGTSSGLGLLGQVRLAEPVI